jgi:hypothetical protein
MPHAQARFHFRNRRVVSLLLSCVLGAVTLTPGVSTSTPGAPRSEALIKWRQSAFQVIAWNTARIKAALAGRYDSGEVRSAADALAAVASAVFAATELDEFVMETIDESSKGLARALHSAMSKRPAPKRTRSTSCSPRWRSISPSVAMHPMALKCHVRAAR